MLVARARHQVADLPASEMFVTAELVKCRKPELDAYLLGAQLLGLAPQECAVVENASVGVLSGLVASYRVITVNAPVNTLRLADVDFVLDSLTQLSVAKQPNGDVVVSRKI